MKPKKNKKKWFENFHFIFLIFLSCTLVTSLSILKDKRNDDLEYRKKVVAEQNSYSLNFNNTKSRGDKNITSSVNSKNSKKFIVIDPGHGGFDCGASSNDNKVQEKDLTLQISKKVKAYLEQENYEVLLTRSTDKAMDSATNEIEDLKGRSSIISTSNAAALVSIHINSSTDSSATGIYNYVSNNSKSSFNEKNLTLSKNILNSISNFSDWKSVETVPQNIYILNKATMPSVLVECGFITNKNDLKKLQNPYDIDDLAKGIADGIMKFTENDNKN